MDVNASVARKIVTLSWRNGNQTYVSASVETETDHRFRVRQERLGVKLSVDVCAISSLNLVVRIR